VELMENINVVNNDALTNENSVEYMIEATNLTKQFGKLEVFKDISVNVKKGEVVVIIGPSGSGKSTFLRCLNHLEEINGGQVVIEGELLDGKNMKLVKKITTKMGMVFQNFNLFPHMTVMDNIMSGPIISKKMKRDVAIADAKKLLKKVGLEDKINYYPSKLSGGAKAKSCNSKSTRYEP